MFCYYYIDSKPKVFLCFIVQLISYNLVESPSFSYISKLSPCV